jgi:DNA ligase-1|tara:strand:- start:23330 stop:24493 length:1164 start_codon:yes stop_codon:yes gene_type:complete
MIEQDYIMTGISVNKTLYKIDSNGKIRVWYMESKGSKYRTVAGIKDGKLVTSTWRNATAKNTGKINGTTPDEQAIVEVEAKYKQALEGEYKESIDAVGNLTYFKPMLANKWENQISKVTFPCYVQPKLDGVRCVFTKDGPKSRTGKPIVTIPHIEKALAPIFDVYPDFIADGELYNHALKNDFNEIISIVRKTKPTPEDLIVSEKMVQYHIYDFPQGDRFKTQDSNFFERFRVGQLYPPTNSTRENSPICIVETLSVDSIDDVDRYHGIFLEQGYEGTIVRLDAPYEQKRSNTLLKRKDFEDAEFEIVRIEEGIGNWSDCAKRVVFKNDDGGEVGAGLKGTMEYTKRVLADAQDYIGKQVTIQFFTRTPDGIPRFPVAKALHKNKRW